MADAPDPAHPAQPETQRLFFALWPDAATRDALNRTGKWLHQHWGGRRMRADTLHLTLAFLGNTPLDARDALLPHIGAIRADAFDLTLDRAGCWQHNRIGWLGCFDQPAPLSDLANRLRGALRASDATFDTKPFVPHVTLLRNTQGGPVPACVPVRWRVNEFVLVASCADADGAYYHIVQRWPLT